MTAPFHEQPLLPIPTPPCCRGSCPAMGTCWSWGAPAAMRFDPSVAQQRAGSGTGAGDSPGTAGGGCAGHVLELGGCYRQQAMLAHFGHGDRRLRPAQQLQRLETSAPFPIPARSLLLPWQLVTSLNSLEICQPCSAETKLISAVLLMPSVSAGLGHSRAGAAFCGSVSRQLHRHPSCCVCTSPRPLAHLELLAAPRRWAAPASNPAQSRLPAVLVLLRSVQRSGPECSLKIKVVRCTEVNRDIAVFSPL